MVSATAKLLLIFILLRTTSAQVGVPPRIPLEEEPPEPFWLELFPDKGRDPPIDNDRFSGHQSDLYGPQPEWQVLRSVKEYGAAGDAKTDDTAAIQAAINDGGIYPSRDDVRWGDARRPAVVYFPAGTYKVCGTIHLTSNTVLMGDPTRRPFPIDDHWPLLRISTNDPYPYDIPIITACSNRTSDVLIKGYDRERYGLNGHYIGIKNLVLMGAAVPDGTRITILELDGSQAVEVTNTWFQNRLMGSEHHGIVAKGLSSGLILSNIRMYGGSSGIALSGNLQYHLLDIIFKQVWVAVLIGERVAHVTGQGLIFQYCGTGVQTYGDEKGSISLIDSQGVGTNFIVHVLSDLFLSGLLLENVSADKTTDTLKVGDQIVIKGAPPAGQTWIRGDGYMRGTPHKQNWIGNTYDNSRPGALVGEDGAFINIRQPAYEDWEKLDIINVKLQSDAPIYGDGWTDDTANIQELINWSVTDRRKVLFFPHGNYIITDTLHIPPGTRMLGQIWTRISASSGMKGNWRDVANPKPVIQVGKPGDVGEFVMSDFIITVAEPLPGAVMMEVNMAGTTPGAVAFFNVHFRYGGIYHEQDLNCWRPQNCPAAHLSVHLKPTSSSYWENTWSWPASHEFKPPIEHNGLMAFNDTQNGEPSVGGGFLIEALKGTWIHGLSVENHALYQVSIHQAENVFIGLQQSKSARWQVKPKGDMIQEPWISHLLPGEPDFSWCGPAPFDPECRVAITQRVQHSNNIFIYGTTHWNLECAETDCQDNMVFYHNNTNFYSYGLVANSINVMILDDDSNLGVVERKEHTMPGMAFQPGFVTAYLRQRFPPAVVPSVAPPPPRIRGSKRSIGHTFTG